MQLFKQNIRLVDECSGIGPVIGTINLFPSVTEFFITIQAIFVKDLNIYYIFRTSRSLLVTAGMYRIDRRPSTLYRISA